MTQRSGGEDDDFDGVPTVAQEEEDGIPLSSPPSREATGDNDDDDEIGVVDGDRTGVDDDAPSVCEVGATADILSTESAANANANEDAPEEKEEEEESTTNDDDGSVVLENENSFNNNDDDDDEEDDPPLRRENYDRASSLAASAPSILGGLLPPHSHSSLAPSPCARQFHGGGDDEYEFATMMPSTSSSNRRRPLDRFAPRPRERTVSYELPPPSQSGAAARPNSYDVHPSSPDDLVPPPLDAPPSPATTTTADLSTLTPVPLSSLPVDALHAASTYCTPRDWAALASTSTAMGRIGREVFRKVWRHAGRCMVEVGIAWATGEHADARELAALYVSEGVPCYPAPHGHSYHTVAWRMRLELERRRANTNDDDSGGGNNTAEGGAAERGGANGLGRNAAGTAAVGGGGGNGNRGNATGGSDATTDPFYAERHDDGDDPPDNHRNNNGHHHHRDFFSRSYRPTYVEEKAVFWKRRKGIEVIPPPPAAASDVGDDGSFPFPRPQARGAPSLPRRFSFNEGWAEAGGGGQQAASRVHQMGMARPPPLPAARGGAGGVVATTTTTRPAGGMGLAAGGGTASLSAGMGGAMARPPGGSRREMFSDRFPAPPAASAAAAASAPSSATTTTHTGGPRSTGVTHTAIGGGGGGGGPRYVRRNSYAGIPSDRSTPAANFAPAAAASTAAAASGTTRAGRASVVAPSPPAPARRMTMRVHRHLADRHLFGRGAVDDENGGMSAGKLSMNADFFHPTWDGMRDRSGFAPVADHHRPLDGWRTGAADANPGGVFGDNSNSAATLAAAIAAFGEDGPDDVGNADFPPAPDDAEAAALGDGNYRAAVRAFVAWTLANAGGTNGGAGGGGAMGDGRRNSLPADNRGGGRLHALLGDPSSWGATSAAAVAADRSPAADVRLEVYGSSSAGLLKSEEGENDAAAEAVAAMRARAKFYGKRLDELLGSDAAGDGGDRHGVANRFDVTVVQECLLDFWDELFPTTAGIHFYNQQSPVPRMTHLHSFLTTPCPKALGTIQCEIERVKVSSKSKGAVKGVTKGVRGKFFPSYEYRLFVRDTKNDNPFHAGRVPPRRDSVLLVARNKGSGGSKGGRNNGASLNGGGHDRSGSGVGGLDFAPSAAANPASNASRRGVTNYYMCLPGRSDVDGHYRSANRNNPNATLLPGEGSGLAVSPMVAAADDAAASAKAASGSGKNNNGGGGAVEVGRLQSNFIGTEFQIFVPNVGVLESRNAEERRRRGGGRAMTATATTTVNEADVTTRSEEAIIRRADAAYALPDAPATGRRSSRRGSGLSRMVRRASSTLSRRGSSSNLSRQQSEAEPAGDAGGEGAAAPTTTRRRASFGSKKAMRRMSWGSTNGGNISGGGSRHHRTSRRAIANNYEALDLDLNDASFSSAAPNSGPVNGGGEVENGAITYTANLLGNRPRIMDVCIPKLQEDGRVCDEWSGERRESAASNGVGADTMLDRFKTIQQGLESLEDNMVPPGGNGNDNNNDNMNNNGGDNAAEDNGGANPPADNHGLMILQNRPPWWNIELGAFVLNFGGRVKVASVKNFQLCERNDRDHIMQFGRIEGRHAFTMDFHHPLTPMQAFAIAISSLQSKISFG